MAIRYIKCPDCGGIYHSCPTCRGARFLEEDTMDLKELEEVNEAINVKADPTNPNHYKSQTSLECIEAMEVVFGHNAVIDFCVCNAWKYIWRWKNKNGLEDLKKAKWYIEKAWELINDEFAMAARSKFSDILTRMSNYIDKVERKMKNDKDN